MVLTGIYKVIAETAQEHGVDTSLALAIAEVESGFDPFAARYEPGFRYTDRNAKRPRACTVQTELNQQSTSWGLMQVMGIVARELGHRGWLSELVQAEVGALYGVLFIKKKMERFGSQGIEAVISAYNAGKPISGNRAYVEKVLAAKVRWEKELS